jgi:hypothetical protein
MKKSIASALLAGFISLIAGCATPEPPASTDRPQDRCRAFYPATGGIIWKCEP